MDDLLPEVYKTRRPLHDDWPWPFSRIPRRWTGMALCMPPKKVCGTAEPRWVAIRPGYPLAPDAELRLGSANTIEVRTMDPVPPIGKWSMQSVYIKWLGRRVPCFFSFSAMVFGRRLHFNGPLKPDVTTSDWFWWFECSLSWTKVS